MGEETPGPHSIASAVSIRPRTAVVIRKSNHRRCGLVEFKYGEGIMGKYLTAMFFAVLLSFSGAAAQPDLGGDGPDHDKLKMKRGSDNPPPSERLKEPGQPQEKRQAEPKVRRQMKTAPEAPPSKSLRDDNSFNQPAARPVRRQSGRDKTLGNQSPRLQQQKEPRSKAPERSGREQIRKMGITNVPKPITNKKAIMAGGGGRVSIPRPSNGPKGGNFSPKLISPRSGSSGSIRTKMSALSGNTTLNAKINYYNTNETQTNNYYWHNDGGYTYCHYYDPYGYHWYGWYFDSGFFWTRYYYDRWWWYDESEGRWCYWHDGWWWWQDPYRSDVVFVFDGSAYISVY
jgi:hypothetical protein